MCIIFVCLKGISEEFIFQNYDKDGNAESYSMFNTIASINTMVCLAYKLSLMFYFGINIRSTLKKTKMSARTHRMQMELLKALMCQVSITSIISTASILAFSPSTIMLIMLGFVNRNFCTDPQSTHFEFLTILDRRSDCLRILSMCFHSHCVFYWNSIENSVSPLLFHKATDRMKRIALAVFQWQLCTYFYCLLSSD